MYKKKNKTMMDPWIKTMPSFKVVFLFCFHTLSLLLGVLLTTLPFFSFHMSNIQAPLRFNSPWNNTFHTQIHLGISTTTPPTMFLGKHFNYLHMASHMLGEFQHLASFRNLGLTLTSRWVGLNPLQISQLVQRLVTQDYHLPFHSLIVDLCLVQGLNANTSFRPPPY